MDGSDAQQTARTPVLADPLEARARPWTLLNRDETGKVVSFRAPSLQLWRIRRASDATGSAGRCSC